MLRKILDFVKEHKKVFIISGAVILLLLIAFVIYLIVRPKPPVIEEDTYYGEGAYEGRIASQNYGKSEGFYTPESAGEKVYIDFGNGNYDITDMIEGWSFGIPEVNLKKYASLVGLSLTNQKPDKYIGAYGAEVYANGEDVDLEKRKSWYLLDEEGNWIATYLVTSKKVVDNNGIVHEALSVAREDESDEDKAPIVSVSVLPYKKDGYIFDVTAELRYEDNLTRIILSPVEQ